MEYRFAEGAADRYPALAADLVRAQVDVIVRLARPATHGGETGNPDHPNRLCESPAT